jgi:hypothetical protein
MATTSPDPLDAWIQQHPLARRDRNRHAFLAVRDEVQAAIDAGYAIKTIWAYLHQTQRIGFSYDTFLRYVHRARPAPPSTASATPARSTAHPATRPPAMTPAGAPVPFAVPAVTPAAAVPAGFTFNATPDKEELL